MSLRRAVNAVIPPLLLGMVMIALWQWVVVAFEIKPFIVPSPSGIWEKFAGGQETIVAAARNTGGNALLGLLLGSLAGILVALLASMVKVADWMLAPIVAALSVIPIVALAPVFYAMFGAAVQTGRVLIAAVAVFVPMYLNTLHGLRQVAPVRRDLMRAYAASGAQVARYLTFPSALPYCLAGLKIGSSLAVISALIAEYFGGPAGGLGMSITSAAAASNYPMAWAYVLGSIVLGVMFYGVTALIENLSLRHRSGT